MREAWNASGDASNHVNHFFDAHALGSALMHAGLPNPYSMSIASWWLSDAMTLMRELKAIGAHNVTREVAHDPHGTRATQRHDDRLRTLRRDGQLPATWEVIHASAWGAERTDTETAGRCARR